MTNPDEIIEFEDGWRQIESKAISKLQNFLKNGLTSKTKPFPAQEYSPIYTLCYKMCTQRSPHNWSDQLYSQHSETMRNYLATEVLTSLEDKHDEFLLKELVVRWGHHKIMNRWMQKFFMYLDRYHVKHHSLPTLNESGLKIFKELIFDAVKDNVVSAILKVIEQERRGEIVDRTLLRETVSVFEAMGMNSLEVYTQELEAPILEHSSSFYFAESQRWISADSTPVYLEKSEAVLNDESKRVENYLVSTTEPKLRKACEIELLQNHETELLEKEGSGCRYLLENDKKDDLSRMFRLFGLIEGGLDPIASTFRSHVTKCGDNIVNKREAAIAARGKDSASDPTFVQSLIDLHDKYKKSVEGEFKSHNLFQKALKEAFESFVNSDVGKITNAELMSTFCDRILKTGGEKLNESQIEEYLEKVVQLFSYLSDKDLFSEVYRNQLAKRLLNGRSTSDDAERSMISKLKLRCGAQFTGKMEGMITDLSLGDDAKRNFKEYIRNLGAADALPFEFIVEVLTTGFWPTYKMLDLTLTPEMAKCIEVYTTYYDSKTNHRQLKWVHSLGNASVKALYKKSYDLQVTTLQAVALTCFNSGQEWFPFAELKKLLNLDEEVVKRVVHSLSCGKYKVLQKEPKSKGISKSDKFRINEKFSCPMRKIRIPMASLEDSHNPKRVEEDRSIAIEAAIVRIMKARKQLPHVQLITEVLQQLHFFKPNPKIVKQRIEHLIDREYLERDEEQSNVYKYLA